MMGDKPARDMKTVRLDWFAVRYFDAVTSASERVADRLADENRFVPGFRLERYARSASFPGGQPATYRPILDDAGYRRQPPMTQAVLPADAP